MLRLRHPGLVPEVLVGAIEPEEVLALDVEDQHPEVGRRFLDDVGTAGQHAQEEQRERGLGGHAADARDGHVAALAAVEEVEVDIHRLAIPSGADGERAAHLVGVERFVALQTGSPPHHLTRIGQEV